MSPSPLLSDMMEMRKTRQLTCTPLFYVSFFLFSSSTLTLLHPPLFIPPFSFLSIISLDVLSYERYGNGHGKDYLMMGLEKAYGRQPIHSIALLILDLTESLVN
jgi:hypothetical protein